jgi:hypothetical protein
MWNKIKEGIKTVLAFTTGLGFYGLGLLIGGLVALLIGWTVIGSGLTGAFIYKNYKAIVDYVKGDYVEKD